ncbi:MAG: hypothetical protein GX072_11340, partial [Lysinibacillus sp.]|nr:hypothetical protein [Lysinibacillus sp.]
MPNYTKNYNLVKPLQEEFYDVDDFNQNADIIDAELKKNANNLTQVQEDIASHLADKIKHLDYAIASGTNTYSATIEGVDTLVEGMSIKVKFTNANTGPSTLNINGLGAKSIRKGNGNTLSSGNIKAGQILHLAYTGSVFQILGEGGEYGTATANDVRNTKTFGTEYGVIQGALDLSKLIPTNIRKGITIDGVIGSLTPLTNEKKWAIVTDVISEKATYSNGGSYVAGSVRFAGNYDHASGDYSNYGWVIE